MNDWDLISPLTDLDDLLAGADSGSYDLEDILTEFGKPLVPSVKTDRPKGISEKKPPGKEPDGGGKKANREQPEEQNAPRQKAAGGILIHENPSDVPQREETEEEMCSGAQEKAAAFSSIVSPEYKRTVWSGRRLSKPFRRMHKDILPKAADLEQYEAPQTEIEPEQMPESIHPEQETDTDMLRKEEIRMETEPVQINEAEPADIGQEEENGEEFPGSENCEEAVMDLPHKTGLLTSLRKALEQADEYAQNMYPEETDAEDKEAEDSEDPEDPEEAMDPEDSDDSEEPEEPEEFDVRAWEEGKKKLTRKRRPLRPAPPPEPERPPEEMAKRYAKGLSGLRLRIYAVFFLCLALLYIVFCEKYQFPLPGGTQNRFVYCLFTSLVLECAVAVLGLHVLIQGVHDLIRLQIGFDTLVVFSVIASLADGLCLLTLGYRAQSLPFCAISAASILFSMWGGYMKRRGIWMTYRAASASEPYVVTRDKKKWNTQGCITKHPGRVDGFVTQVEQPDGADRIFARIAPLLLIASLIFAVLASVGRQRPVLFLWSFSAITAAAAAFSAFLSFSLPFSVLARRLMHSGAALAGWRGLSAMAGKNGIILTDTDLFPPGSVSLNGIKVFGDFPVDKVVSCAASIMREAECGLEKIFHELLRSQGAIYRRVEDFCFYEEGGYGANIRGDQVLVGSAAFMRNMDVPLTQGLKVKNAVFCAIDGELAGIFAVNYSPNAAVRGFMSTLMRSKLTPVLATRDFSLSPAMLAQKFKLRLDRLQFPPMERRIDLSRPHAPHSKTITALLSREGLPPLAEAVVGGRRLRRAALTSTAISVAGSIVGMLMACYLTSAEAFASISAANLFFFMLLWLVPILLISSRANRF